VIVGLQGGGGGAPFFFFFDMLHAESQSQME
jgi:hypothetical protein